MFILVRSKVRNVKKYGNIIDGIEAMLEYILTDNDIENIYLISHDVFSCDNIFQASNNPPIIIKYFNGKLTASCSKAITWSIDNNMKILNDVFLTGLTQI